MATAQDLSTEALFTQYVRIVNQAIGEHRDEFPYDKIVDYGEKALSDKKVGVAIYKTDPEHPHDYFTLKFDDGTFDVSAHGKKEPDISWKLPESHMENVINAPKEYIDSPMKLDLDWLMSRAGVM